MINFNQWLLEVESIIDKLRIDHQETTERTRRGVFPAIDIKAYIGDVFVGDLYLVQDDGNWVAYGVNVLPDYRRRGIATTLYNYAEKLLGIKLKPSSSQTDDGKAFWQARQK